MPAPDLPPAPESCPTDRALFVYLQVRLIDPRALVGGVVVVIDALRASVTMTAALANGALAVVPALTVDDAIAKRDALAAAGERNIVLGGERGGVKIPGFDLDNSPKAYTRDRLEGRRVVFTTSNGTAALLHASGAQEILVGSFANLSAVCRVVKDEVRPVHLLCCGTRDDLSMDDILPAGAMAERLGRLSGPDDSANVAVAAWRGALASPGGLRGSMEISRGGRNLARQGLGDDVAYCCEIDRFECVPRFDPVSGEVTIRR